MFWTAYNYDVWGNEKDGYEVNNVYKLEHDVYIDSEVEYGDKDFIRFVKRLFSLKKKLRFDSFDFDGDDSIIFVNYRGYPVGEFRKQDGLIG